MNCLCILVVHSYFYIYFISPCTPYLFFLYILHGCLLLRSGQSSLNKRKKGGDRFFLYLKQIIKIIGDQEAPLYELPLYFSCTFIFLYIFYIALYALLVFFIYITRLFAVTLRAVI